MKTDKKVVAMDKVSIDNIIKDIIALKAKKKAIEDELKKQVEKIEGLYAKEASVVEIIYGNEYQMKKIPSDRGKNKFNVELVENYLAMLAADVPTAGVIKTVKEVDSKKFNALAEDGYITDAMLDAARLHKWTFSSQFSEIAEAE